MHRKGFLMVLGLCSGAVAQIPAAIITTVAGAGGPGYSGNGGPATAALTGKPEGITFDKAGNLYFTDPANHVVRMVSQGIITTVAGNGTAGYSGDNGPAINAQLGGPYALAFDSTGSLYISDTAFHVVRKVSGGIITTMAGTGTGGFNGDNIVAATAQLNTPASLAFDARWQPAWHWLTFAGGGERQHDHSR
jgi:hypothetical protein